MDNSLTMPFSMRIKLSAMMFLQYMMLPVWFIPMFPYVAKLDPSGHWAFWCGLIMGLGTCAAPLVGMFADRFFNAEKVLGVCNFVCAALLFGCYYIDNPQLLFWMLLVTMILYMPSWSLTAGIAMSNSTAAAFPHIRVFGSLGWVASAVFSVIGIKCLGIENFDSTRCIFMGGAIAAALGGVLSFFLPATPPKAKGTPMSIVDALGLKALLLMKRPEFLVFSVALFLSMIPFQWYMVYNSVYLQESGFKYLTLTTNLGQVGELGFLMLIPLILKKVGYKWTIAFGILALAFRYACFYGSVKFGLPALDFGGILIHGLIFGLIIVGAQMYVEDSVSPVLRNQAQGLVMFLTCGIAAFASNAFFQRILDANEIKPLLPQNAPTHDWSTPYLIALLFSLGVAIFFMLCFKPKTK